jgi:hypothetical protein
MWFGVGDDSAQVPLLMTIKMQDTNAIRRITGASFTDTAAVSRE